MCVNASTQCMRDGCQDDASIATFTSACDDAGCLALECGIEEKANNRTAQESSLLCTRVYLECEVQEERVLQEPAKHGSDSPCASGCISAYFKCMRSRSYLSQAQVDEHLALCQQAGCTPWECGIAIALLPLSSFAVPAGDPGQSFNASDPSQYSAYLPDSPVRLRLVATDFSFLRVSWDNSPLANYWRRVQAPFGILRYEVALEDHCEEGQAASCRGLRSNITTPVAVGHPNVAEFRNLTADVVYQISVVAVNQYGSSPVAASIMHRLSAAPCGDGIIFQEQCDDGDQNADDGCFSCEIERGWACWGQPSTCCGPCPAGQFRFECGLALDNQPRSVGRCLPCPAGTYKAGVLHVGEDCLGECDTQQGPCAWCGAGVCCRKGEWAFGCTMQTMCMA